MVSNSGSVSDISNAVECCGKAAGKSNFDEAIRYGAFFSTTKITENHENKQSNAIFGNACAGNSVRALGLAKISTSPASPTHVFRSRVEAMNFIVILESGSGQRGIQILPPIRKELLGDDTKPRGS